MMALSLLVVLSGVVSLGGANLSWSATFLRGEGRDALAETIGHYASNRELLAQHQAATLQRQDRAGLDRYKTDLISVIREISTSAMVNGKSNAAM
jgi:hypothetical protein